MELLEEHDDFDTYDFSGIDHADKELVLNIDIVISVRNQRQIGLLDGVFCLVDQGRPKHKLEWKENSTYQ